jgi:hypothetical protein
MKMASLRTKNQRPTSSSIFMHPRRPLTCRNIVDNAHSGVLSAIAWLHQLFTFRLRPSGFLDKRPLDQNRLVNAPDF